MSSTLNSSSTPAASVRVRLSDLIGDLLFLTRAEGPVTGLRRERVNVDKLLDAVCDYYEASAAHGGSSLAVDESAEPVTTELDRALMLRAVSNLVSNAIAHTLLRAG